MAFKFDVGDERSNNRAASNLEKLMQQPGKSFPKVFPDSAGLEGFYRFLNNSNIKFDDLMTTAYTETSSHLENVRECVVIHDTTRIVSGPKVDSIPEFKEDHGFRMHLSLLASAGSEAEVYGPGSVSFFTRVGGTLSLENENSRWWQR